MHKYRIVKHIGEGAYGDVFEAIEKSSSETVAIKRFKDNQDADLAKRELQTAVMVSSKNIVKCYESFRHDNLLHLVFEYVEGGNLLQLLDMNPTGLPPNLIKKLMYELCVAVHTCIDM